LSSKNLILTSALHHFSKYGFEGASLGMIAEDANIKKPSIYAHFKSKEDLFMNVFSLAEREVKKRTFQYFIERYNRLNMRETLEAFPLFLIRNYQDEPSFGFLLRHSFFPPESLMKEVMDRTNPLLDLFQELLRKRFERIPQEEIIASPQDASIAYLTLVDGILIEMLFAWEEKALLRMNAAWPIFCRGVFAEEQK
jgi:AcrR family transcriptional regulator